jgi:eukaryotic-like serine/threonine-protein kinase
VSGTPDWDRIEAALDAILAQPQQDWKATADRVCGNDGVLRSEVQDLLAHVGGKDPLLDVPLSLGSAAAAATAPLQSGARLGAYRLIELIGSGGMGEVYRAERDDGQFDQQVAVKLMHRDAAEQLERFQVERQILARLEHPGIARLHDGGISADGRPYMVMELVRGQPILGWCQEHHCDLAQRLHLFLQVCAAVAYAHRNLIVHRDLKPSNVLVTENGEVKLLDFGIAKMLGAPRSDLTQNTPLTPGYAAPEQLTNATITTATDVYALGLLLFEMLAGAPPWRASTLPVASALEKVLRVPPPRMSEVAAASASTAVPAQRLRGDLDAIVAKALRKEPEYRYETVAAFEQDITRALRCEPVAARAGARLYVLSRFARRHRVLIAAAAVILFAVTAGLIGVSLEAARARHEAARATAVKNFLISIFRASDPRIASDKPLGQITAKELLDRGTERIGREFRNQPNLQLELLGIVDDIYGYLLDDDRYEAVMKQRMALARKLHGDHDPIVIDGTITDAWALIYTQNFTAANELLAKADRLLREANLDDSALRGEWWLAKAQTLLATPDAQGERGHALEEAIALYGKHDPLNSSYSAALANLGSVRFAAGRYADSKSLNQQAIAAAMKEPERSDSDVAVMEVNLGRALQMLGELDAAETAYDRSAALTLATNGAHYGTYWNALSRHARLLYLRGESARAWAMFKTMLATIPVNWKYTTDDAIARQQYGECLARDGRVDAAIPVLEASERALQARPIHEWDVRRVSAILGDAYDRAGRVAQARTQLAAAYRESLQRDPAASDAQLAIRERWARFGFEHAQSARDITAAKVALRQLLQEAPQPARFTTAITLAHADLARIALTRGDGAAAMAEAAHADEALAAVQALHDVRLQVDIWRLRAQAAQAAGARSAADHWRQLAHAGAIRYGLPDT